MTRMLFRSLVIVALMFAGGRASAGGPLRTPLGEGLPPGTVIPLGIGPCAFPVALTIVTNQEIDTKFPANPTAQTQRHLVTGNLVVAFTNEDSLTTVTRDVSGPGRYIYSTDPANCGGPTGCSFHLSAWGTWAFFFFPDQRGLGTPGALFINNGFIFESQDPAGIQTVLTQVGTQEDLCAALE
jgi:hypothetical protein